MSRPGPLRIRTTKSQHSALHEAVNRTRRSSKTVTVDRDALENVLLDFAHALDRLPEGYDEADGSPGP